MKAIRLMRFGNFPMGGRDCRIVAVPSRIDTKKNPRRIPVLVDDWKDDARHIQRITPPARVYRSRMARRRILGFTRRCPESYPRLPMPGHAGLEAAWIRRARRTIPRTILESSLPPASVRPWRCPLGQGGGTVASPAEHGGAAPRAAPRPRGKDPPSRPVLGRAGRPGRLAPSRSGRVRPSNCSPPSGWTHLPRTAPSRTSFP